MYILPGALAPLAKYCQFILVQFVPRYDTDGVPVPGKTDKLPCDYRTGMRTPKNSGGAHNPEFWTDCVTAAAMAHAMGATFGIGFVITEADPFICLDLDECDNGAGGWTPEAVHMLTQFPGAIELSNSGRGLHVWGRYSGVCPPHRKKSKGVLVRKWLELYSEKRFIALGTGGASGAIQDVTNILPSFIQQWFPYDPNEDEDVEWTEGPCAEYTVLTDEELFIKARASVPPKSAGATFGGEVSMPSFSDLFDRNIAVLARAFPPQMPGKDINGSDADAMLAKELAYWTGRDCARIERLMLMSSMKRDKWFSHRKYLHDTILNGMSRCKAVYRVKPLLPVNTAVATGKLEPQVIQHQTFVARERMAEVFKDCVYIQDNNSILLPNGDIVDQSRFNAKYAGYMFVMDDAGTKLTNKAWDAFLGNQLIHFPRVEGTTFEPNMPFQTVVQRGGRSWVNVYLKPEIIRAPGDIVPFLTLLKKLLPNGDDALILLSYIAAVCQYPGVKFRWAPFLQGTPGNGKSTIISCLKYALGNKYIFSVKAGMIENNFNSWLEYNVLYVADDIYSTRDRTDMMEALKSMITERDHGITLKGIDSLQKRICGNFIFTDNHKDAMKKTDDSRRLATLYCAQQSKADRMRDGLTKEFFTGYLIPWLENGGYAAVADYLHTMPIDPRYNPAGDCQEAPDTSVTSEAIVDGRTAVEHEVAEWIELQEPGFCGDFVSVVMLKKKLESIPRFAKSATYLKIKEMMGRLGYEIHRGMKDGRCEQITQPDGTRPVLYVRRDTDAAEIKGAVEVGQRYEAEQQAALTAAIERRFNHGG